MAALTVVPSLSDSQRDWSLFSSLTLLPASRPPILLQAWTLVHELLFYIVFVAYFYVARGVFAVLVMVWALLILCAALLGRGASVAVPVQRLLATLNLEFVLGMACAAWLRHASSARWAWPLCALGGAALVLLIAAMPHSQQAVESLRLLFGGAFAALICGLVALERKYPRHLWWPLVWLGDSSYSQYLVHFAAASVVARLFRRFVPDGQPLLAVGACVVVVLVCTAAYYAVFERHAIAALRRRLAPYALTAP